MSESGTTRISIEVSTEINEKLNNYLPWGVKAQVIRALIELLLDTQSRSAVHIVDDLLRGRCKLVVVDGVQNLNNGTTS